jgi:hypothetical protein
VLYGVSDVRINKSTNHSMQLALIGTSYDCKCRQPVVTAAQESLINGTSHVGESLYGSSHIRTVGPGVQRPSADGTCEMHVADDCRFFLMHNRYTNTQQHCHCQSKQDLSWPPESFLPSSRVKLMAMHNPPPPPYYPDFLPYMALKNSRMIVPQLNKKPKL